MSDKSTMIEKVEEGVMAMKDGLAWGVVYADGRATAYGWTDPADIKHVLVSDPRYARRPSDLACHGSPDAEKLEQGKLVRVRRTTTVEILPDKKDDRNWRCFT